MLSLSDRLDCFLLIDLKPRRAYLARRDFFVSFAQSAGESSAHRPGPGVETGRNLRYTGSKNQKPGRSRCGI